jgi:class 3 adenylate cyclase
MGLKEDLTAEVKKTLAEQWETQTATDVPDPEDLRLNANHAKDFEKGATILYADLDGSTNMVDKYPWWFSAEIYKIYLRCASEIVRNENGVISAYDGDRVMGVYTGDSKNTSAVRTALKINWAVEEIIRPAIKAQYPDKDFLLKHVIGVDTSRLRTARIGVKGDNDLVWVGRAANYAAKLCALSEKPLWITKAIYDNMHNDVKFSNSKLMWDARTWTSMNGMQIYCSTYRWPL